MGKAVEKGHDPHTMDRFGKDDESNQPLYLPLYVFNRTMIVIQIAFLVILGTLLYCIYDDNNKLINNKLIKGGGILTLSTGDENDRGLFVRRTNASQF